MYFIIHKPVDKFELFSNEIWQTEQEANEYGKRNKFPKKIQWKVSEYNATNWKTYYIHQLKIVM